MYFFTCVIKKKRSRGVLYKLCIRMPILLEYLKKYGQKLFFIQLFALFLIPASSLLAFAENVHKVEIIAHHGVLEDVPENTFAALRRVVELGIDGIEIDIRQTKDHQLILMCDETIDRTTNGKGRVDQLLYAEIQQYDAGSWRGLEFKDEPIPLLSDVLEFCKINNLKLILNARQVCIEKQVLDLVRSYNMYSQVYLWGTLRNLNTEEAEQFVKELILVSPEEMTEEKIVRIHEGKKYAFSIILNSDDRKTIKDQINMGVDVILMDYPCVAQDILGIQGQIPVRQGSFKSRKTNHPQQEEIDNKTYVREKVKALVKTIKDTDPDKARTATMALMVLPQRYTIPPLVKLLKNKHPQTKQDAAWALGFCGNGDIAIYIQSLLSDKNPEVRREAVLALGRLGSTQSVPVLIETLKTETNRGVKYDIARTLGILKDPGSAFPLLTILTNEKDWYVKSAAVEALSHIYTDKAVHALADILVTDAGEDAAWTRTKAAWALAAMGKESIPQLIRALSDNEEVTRRRAEWALVKIGQPAVRSLVHALREPNKFARERGAQALGWIEDKSTVTALIWALKDTEPSVVCSAVWALGKIGDPKALSALQFLMNHKNSDIRENANEAVERILAKKENMVYYKKSMQKP